MRYILVYFQKKIVDGLSVYVYTSRKSMTGSVSMNGTTETFSVTFWDGKPKEKSGGVVTMWLNDKSPEECQLYCEVYGKEAVLQVDEDNNTTLMSLSDFNSLPKEDQNVVQPSVFS